MPVGDGHRARGQARRFKAALLNEGFAVSPDSVRWTKLGVPVGQSLDEGNISDGSREGLFIRTLKRRGPYTWTAAVAIRRDFQKWHDYGLGFHADELGQEIGRPRIAERLANLKGTKSASNSRFGTDDFAPLGASEAVST